MSELAKIRPLEAPALITEPKILATLDSASRELAELKTVPDYIDHFNKVEAIRTLATKAKLDRDVLNRVGRHLIRTVRLAGAQSIDLERIEGRPEKNVHQCTLSATDLGYSHRAHRQRWELIARLPDNICDETLEKIQGSTDKTINLAGVLTVAKQWAREKEAADRQQEVLEEGCTVEDLHDLIRAGKKFSVIYADPPWQFKVYSGKGKDRSAEHHYAAAENGESFQTIDEIKAMPMAELAAEDCALFLWGVWPELPGALEIIKAWGFKYKTSAFVWVKETKNSNGDHWGMGYWTRANSEPCLLATKGSPQRLAKDVHQIIRAPVSEHSRKPDEAAARIERLVSGPYLEIYARRPMKGWTTWGIEIARASFHQRCDHP